MTSTTTAMLTDSLISATRKHGADPKQVGLTALCTASLLLGAGEQGPPMTKALSTRERDLPGIVSTLWHAHSKVFPYLRGRLDPLIGWLDAAQPHQVLALRDCLAVCADTDLVALAEAPTVAGDLLGQVLAHLTAPGDQSARGAFYTPATTCQVIAAMTGIDTIGPGATVAEPSCGGGAMIVAAVRRMRSRGARPEEVSWHLNDLDPTAVAVAGIAMSIHGIPWVTLTVGDALAAPQAGAA